jgi:Transposase DNA-binding/Transposase DDE domain
LANLPADSYRLDTKVVFLDMELLSHSANYEGLFSDKRLEKRASLISQSLLQSKSSSVHRATKDEAEQKGFYRFLKNEQVTEDILIKELTSRCLRNIEGRDVVVLQDSSSFGLNHNGKNIKEDSGVGFVGNKQGIGFLSHCSLVIDANIGTMLGFSDIQLWHRKEDKSNNTTGAYKKQTIENKESYKWIKASNASKEVLNKAKSITIIEDREGDIYEQFCCIPDEKTHLLIRSRDDRNLSDGKKLHTALQEAKSLGEYKIEIKGDLRKEKVRRTATVEVKSIAVKIKKPTSAKTKNLPAELKLYAIEVQEKNGTHKDKVCWRILTTHVTETFEQAVLIVNKYKQRWYIEQLFRLLKKQGFKIEDTQLETGWAIRKLLVMLLGTILRLMQIYLAYGEEDSQVTEEVFSKDEIKCLASIEEKQLKITPKTRNPFKPEKLSWASWIIARLGGWKGNGGQRSAGPIIIKRGLEKFEMIYEGWILARDLT